MPGGCCNAQPDAHVAAQLGIEIRQGLVAGSAASAIGSAVSCPADRASWNSAGRWGYLSCARESRFPKAPITWRRRMPDVKITVRKNGPYVVSGLVELKDADGNPYPVKDVIALCRCGASTTKPFCDGTHSKIGFQAAEQAVPGSAET
jgi:3-phenylpropionate/trans-cinnamate dioxygenase ferredoxin subunit